MNSGSVLSFFLSFTFTVFNGKGRYLLVEVDAEMEAMPDTMIEGNTIGSESLLHYPNFIMAITKIKL